MWFSIYTQGVISRQSCWSANNTISKLVCVGLAIRYCMSLYCIISLQRAGLMVNLFHLERRYKVMTHAIRAPVITRICRVPPTSAVRNNTRPYEAVLSLPTVDKCNMGIDFTKLQRDTTSYCLQVRTRLDWHGINYCKIY